MENSQTKKDETTIIKESEGQIPEQGTVQPSPGTTATFPQIYMFPTSNDVPILLGQMKEKLETIEKRLEKIEQKLDSVEERLQGIESVFNALEKLPKVGGIIKEVRDAKIKR